MAATSSIKLHQTFSLRVYIAEAIAWSENGNYAAIYTTGNTAEEADAKLVDALHELNLMSKTSMKDEDLCALTSTSERQAKLFIR